MLQAQLRAGPAARLLLLRKHRQPLRLASPLLSQVYRGFLFTVNIASIDFFSLFFYRHDGVLCVLYVCATGVTSTIGSLNPDLYKSPLIPEEDTSNYPEGHLGRFWFSLNYDAEQEKLLINLIRIHNLPSRDKDSSSACDPLVRFVILSDIILLLLYSLSFSV